jgi:hypothetical protein
VEFLAAILPSLLFVDQPETPDLRQETPHVCQEMPNDLQEAQEYLQETDPEMGKFTWEDLELFQEADEELINFFCKPSRAPEPMRPMLPVLINLIQKYMVKASTLNITKMEDSIPIYERRREEILLQPETPDLGLETPNIRQETPDDPQETGDDLQEITPSQAAIAIAKRAKVEYERTSRIAQEQTQVAAQAVPKGTQDARLESCKAKKADRYKATMQKLGRLPPCPCSCRGKDCSGAPCDEEEMGFSYSHLNVMIGCTNPAHASMAARDRCYFEREEDIRGNKRPQQHRGIGERRHSNLGLEERGRSPRGTNITSDKPQSRRGEGTSGLQGWTGPPNS